MPWEGHAGRCFKSGERYGLRKVFDAYIRFGGMPRIADIDLDQDKALAFLDGIYSTVVLRDILERENNAGRDRLLRDISSQQDCPVSFR